MELNTYERAMLIDYLYCRELLEEEEEEDDPPPPSRNFCEDCVRKNVNYKQKSTLFKPVRLEHLAIVATLQKYDGFDRTTIDPETWEKFKRVALMVDARYYLVSFDDKMYAPVSKIIEIIDKNYNRGHETVINFSFALPICCCTIRNRCAGQKPSCSNNTRFIFGFHFDSIRYGHRVNNTPCCCDGLRTSFCKKRFYVSYGMITERQLK